MISNPFHYSYSLFCFGLSPYKTLGIIKGLITQLYCSKSVTKQSNANINNFKKMGNGHRTKGIAQ